MYKLDINQAAKKSLNKAQKSTQKKSHDFSKSSN